MSIKHNGTSKTLPPPNNLKIKKEPIFLISLSKPKYSSNKKLDKQSSWTFLRKQELIEKLVLKANWVWYSGPQELVWALQLVAVSAQELEQL